MSSIAYDIAEKPKQDRRLSILLVFATAAAVFMILFGIFGFPAIIATADNTTAINRSQDLTSCRAALFAIVTTKEEAFLTAVGDAIGAGQNADKTAITKANAELKAAAQNYQFKVNEAKDDPARFLKECGS